MPGDTKPHLRIIRKYPSCPALVGWWGVFIGGKYVVGSAGATIKDAWMDFARQRDYRRGPTLDWSGEIK